MSVQKFTTCLHTIIKHFQFLCKQRKAGWPEWSGIWMKGQIWLHTESSYAYFCKLKSTHTLIGCTFPYEKFTKDDAKWAIWADNVYKLVSNRKNVCTKPKWYTKLKNIMCNSPSHPLATTLHILLFKSNFQQYQHCWQVKFWARNASTVQCRILKFTVMIFQKCIFMAFFVENEL